jgi:hypothetical protein
MMNFLLDNRTDANLDDLSLAFRDMGIDMNEIIEYVTYVDPIIPATDVPKYPISKESHFNFLKPGSKEVLTRPVHIHEHLPPLNPPEDEPIYNGMNGEKEIDVVGVPSDENGVFKRPADGGLENNAKKIKSEEEGRPTREIHSVMMTTSGFLSPAREGKLPESRAPNLPPEFTKPAPPPITSPPFKPSKELTGEAVDKKLEKKLKKKNHEKEKSRKEKPIKEKHLFDDLLSPVPPVSVMPREANEQMILAERKKALKKLKMKNKGDLNVPKKKKEKPPKPSKQLPLEASFLEALQVPPPASILPPTSQIQAHNFLTGAAHSMFPNPLIDGKLITEPDKNKLNIFKKISKPKDEVKPLQSIDFLSPPRFDMNQPSTSSQVYNDPMKKMHKLPKETTMTRVDDAPINFSMPRSNESSFEELAMPKTPTIVRTPDTEKKEKKERKKKERKINQPDWNQGIQNPFMPDLSSQNNPFLQSLQGSLMGNLGNFPLRNPFAMQHSNELFPSGPGLIPGRAPFGGMGSLGQMGQMMQNTYGFPLPGMDLNMIQQQTHHQQPSPTPKPKKVKPPPKPADDFQLTHGSRFCNVASMLPQTMKERFDAPTLMNVDPFPLQHHQQPLSSFDQLLKDQPQHHVQPLKKISDEKMETFDLTSSPEPMTPLPQPAPVLPEIISAPLEISQQQQPIIKIEQPQPPVQPMKEKSKEKKKKKDKDKDKEKEGSKEERKKVIIRMTLIIFQTKFSSFLKL